MATPFNFTTGKDITLRPQWDDEGDIIATPALYGDTPTDPVFAMAGKNCYLQVNKTPIGADQKKVGAEDEDVKVLIKKEYDAILYTHITDSTLLQWAVNSLGSGVGSINSKTFIQGMYRSGSEYVDVLTGCLPKSCTLRVARDALIMLEIGLDVADVEHMTRSSFNSTILGSGTLASDNTNTPWTANDGGTNPTTHNSNTILERNFVLSVQRAIGELDSSGDVSAIYKKPTARNINVELEAFKANYTLDDDAEALTARTASRVLKSAVSTVSLTNLQLGPVSEEVNPRLTNPLTTVYRGTATAVTVS